MSLRNIYLLNDSFPPLIDGVANAVVNYASELHSLGANPFVFAPKMDGMDDSVFDTPVIRYPSIDTTKQIGYYVGVPLSKKIHDTASASPPSVLHCHCPGVSLILSRSLRSAYHAPIVFTYHTKYDVDIRRILKGNLIQEAVIRSMVDVISSSEEVWTVSRGAGENLRSLGFRGDYIVMENGVDVEKGRVSDEKIRRISEEYTLPDGVPVFLFVGRMQWYKGQRIILDALHMLKASGKSFRMLFVGDGQALDEIRAYSDSLGLEKECIFTGSIRDREKLRAIYCRADLFLFPSVYDTNGLVVREAAASSLASVLVEGSCAAEGVSDGRNGFLIEENANSLFAKLLELIDRVDSMHEVGGTAANELYISWHSAVEKAMDRYQIVEENYLAGRYPPHSLPDHALFLQKKLLDFFREGGSDEDL